MSPVAIPPWDAYGVLPPVNTECLTSTTARSPYNIDLLRLVPRFSTNPTRIFILNGLLDFRETLHSAGITQGFQWLDGSFAEDIESLERRPPGDIDVVTFFSLPSGTTSQECYNAHPETFNRTTIKSKFRVDAYFVSLNYPSSDLLVEQSVYWYSVLSHRRDRRWKGYLQVDLSSSDAAARTALENASASGGHP